MDLTGKVALITGGIAGIGEATASGDLRPDVDPIDLMRAIYGLSTAGNADDWPAT